MEILRIKVDEGVIIVHRQSMSIVEMESEITMSECESEYYKTISSVSRRSEWLTSRLIVRHELGDEVSTYYDNRRPRLMGSDKFISISHCDNLVAVFISDSECGVDIEDRTRNFTRVSSRFLSKEEQLSILGGDIALSWGIKEAAYKKIGVPDIDFATMFEIIKIDKERNSSILRYREMEYKFSFILYENYNIVF